PAQQLVCGRLCGQPLHQLRGGQWGAAGGRVCGPHPLPEPPGQIPPGPAAGPEELVPGAGPGGPGAGGASPEAAADKNYVEKGNKDEVFRYHIAKVVEEDDSLQEEPVLTNQDLVLGVRPEFLDIEDSGSLDG